MGVGCSNATHVTVTSHELDPRVPLTRAELEDIRSIWANVKRRFEDTAKDNLIRLFRYHPYFKFLFPHLNDVRDESDMYVSPEFEAMAMVIFSVFDDVIEHMDDDVDTLLYKLEEIARVHAKIDGFQSEFFQYMEESFIESLHEKSADKFTPREEELFRKLFKWIASTMSLEVEAIEYRLIPGD